MARRSQSLNTQLRHREDLTRSSDIWRLDAQSLASLKALARRSKTTWQTVKLKEDLVLTLEKIRQTSTVTEVMRDGFLLRTDRSVTESTQSGVRRIVISADKSVHLIPSGSDTIAFVSDISVNGKLGQLTIKKRGRVSEQVYDSTRL